MDKEIKKKETSAALSAIMKYLDITTKELSAMTDVPVRSIENYRCGRNDMSTSIAKNIIAIEHALDIDGRILTGNKSISDFFVEEDRRLRERKKAEAAAADRSEWIPADESTGYGRFTVDVEALNSEMPCAAYSKKKDKWYDRDIAFIASSLPSEALRIKLDGKGSTIIDTQEAAMKVIYIALVIIIAGGVLNHFVKRKFYE